MTLARSSLRVLPAPAADPYRLWPLGEAVFVWEVLGQDPWFSLGAARRWSVPDPAALPAAAAEAEALLCTLGTQDGLRPRVFLQIAFEGGAELILPRWSYVQTARGPRLIGVDAPPGAEAPLLEALSTEPARPAGPRRLQLRRPEAASYHAQVEQLRARICAGEVEKVVLSRDTELLAEGGQLHPAAVLAALHHEPEASVRFAVQLQAGACFVGLSPERLLIRRGAEVWTEALAGTQAAGSAEADLQLLASEKDRAEHAYVAEDICARLGPLCAELERGAPRPEHLTHVTHIKTPIRGRLRAPRSLVELVQALHPTPATAGVPREAARAAIAQIEGRPRGPYASALGCFEAGGDGEVWVGLRSAMLAPERAQLFVGGGIVADSDPVAEWQETLLKERTMLRAIEGCVCP